MNVHELAQALNGAAGDYQIGKLQHFRKEMFRMKSRAPGPIFSKKSTHDTWACHSGGRTELQFNIGTDEGGMRYGVAFSLEPSQSLPTIDPLVPKIARFNDFIREHGAKLAGYEMWHWFKGHDRSENGPVQPVSSDLMKSGYFIFVGKIQPFDAIDVSEILSTFDDLMKLYFFIEDTEAIVRDLPPIESTSHKGSEWEFRPGHTPYAKLQTSTYAERTLDVTLRHNDLQTRIFDVLSIQYGKENVGTELGAMSGGEIDLAIKREDGLIFAELKTSTSVKSCVRDAIGQLLEYSYYGTSEVPAELWVIGTGKSSPSDAKYLERLRNKLGIRLFYRRFVEDLGILELPV